MHSNAISGLNLILRSNGWKETNIHILSYILMTQSIVVYLTLSSQTQVYKNPHSTCTRSALAPRTCFESWTDLDKRLIWPAGDYKTLTQVVSFIDDLEQMCRAYHHRYTHFRNLGRSSFGGALSSGSQTLKSMWDQEEDTDTNDLDHYIVDWVLLRWKCYILKFINLYHMIYFFHNVQLFSSFDMFKFMNILLHINCNFS